MSFLKKEREYAPIAVFLVLLCFTSVRSTYFATNHKENDQSCFCKLKGSIDDCTCNVDTVDYFNNMKIYPRLQSLLVKDYFRFYKIDLKRDCPFWSVDSKCATRHCGIKPCEDKDIPVGLKGESLKAMHGHEHPAEKYRAELQDSSCDQNLDNNAELAYLNTSISSENYKDFELWQQYDNAQDNFCLKETTKGEYVDLLLNPERYTGYKGPSAHRIWRSIYMENCFRPENPHHDFIQTSNINAYIKLLMLPGMCLEKRVFYRVISGLHASINVHLCSKYLLKPKNSLEIEEAGTWGPNLDELRRRFSPEMTSGEGPNWLKNLYFIYLIELRALAKVTPYLQKEEFYTGNEADDRDTKLAIEDLLKVIGSFSEHFNESVMFTGGVQSRLLKEEFINHFRNISRIMDCVACDKCKLWGSLQINGLGTALNILFSGKFDGIYQANMLNVSKKQFFLERNDIVSLLNAFGRLSESIFELERFRKVMGGDGDFAQSR